MRILFICCLAILTGSVFSSDEVILHPFENISSEVSCYDARTKASEERDQYEICVIKIISRTRDIFQNGDPRNDKVEVISEFRTATDKYSSVDQKKIIKKAMKSFERKVRNAKVLGKNLIINVPIGKEGHFIFKNGSKEELISMRWLTDEVSIYNEDSIIQELKQKLLHCEASNTGNQPQVLDLEGMKEIRLNNRSSGANFFKNRIIRNSKSSSGVKH